MSQGSCWINGELTTLKEARIPVCDRGLWFGHGVFETLMVLQGQIKTWKEHYERLRSSCQGALIATPAEDFLKKACEDVVAHSQSLAGGISPRAQLRIILTGGSNVDRLTVDKNPQGEPLPGHMFIICRPVKAISASTYAKGISLKSHGEMRRPQVTHIKSIQYLWSILAIEDAQTQGHDDVLFVDDNGLCTESSNASFVWFSTPTSWHTTPPLGHCLVGTTLQRAFEFSEACQLQGSYKSLNFSDIKDRSVVIGCAIASASRGLLPVRQIDTYAFDVSLIQEACEKLNKKLLSP